MTLPNEPAYPARTPPEDAREARLLGLYDQRQPGMLMQRLKVYGGRLSLEQWRAVLRLALTMTPGRVLRLTTRQDLEFHGLHPEQVPELQAGLAEAGITTVGACGDTLRNITECSRCNGLGLAPLADHLRAELGKLECLFSLPRKFKISISGCSRGCSKPYINDLGLVARRDGTFDAVLAGSLGARPATGILCYESLPVGELAPLALAAVKLHNTESDRENRRKARLRHVRERLGDGAFRDKLDVLFAAEKETGEGGDFTIAKPQACSSALRLSIPYGELRGEWLRDLLPVLEEAGGELAIGLEHDLFVRGVDAGDLPPALQNCVSAPRIVACPAAHLCERGLVRTWDVAEKIREALPAACDLTVALSGCPNNCPHAAVADIGFVGRLKTIGDEKQAHFRLLAGGGKGETPDLAEELHPALPAGRATDAAKLLVDRWQATGAGPKLSFGKFVRETKEELVAALS